MPISSEDTLIDSKVLVNHWSDAPEWSAGRALLACYATFEAAPDVQAVVRGYQDRIADLEELDLIRPEWLHLTVQGIAFTDQLGPGELAATAALLAEGLAGQPVIEFRLRPPAFGRDGIYLPVAPVGPLSAARDAIRRTLARARPAGLYALPGQGGRYEPHISFAYANDEIPIEPIRARLALEPAPDLTVPVRELSLLLLRRGQRRWTWTSRIALPLGLTTAITLG